ncbi:unnamed protein product [Echinostoma caproni]|uniref:Endo/exonuclease/phosphatase domain-containing protein n=1 Tax=Echinostoma caproni TaxID=27848 RepID=A0A183ABP8_9TREM|nr:unnamed protein product [Echinostoma caproni]
MAMRLKQVGTPKEIKTVNEVNTNVSLGLKDSQSPPAIVKTQVPQMETATVPSCPTSTTIQVSPIPPPAEALLRPRCPFKLATFNVRTLMRIGQQAGLAVTLETLAIDVCYIQETRIQDSSSII